MLRAIKDAGYEGVEIAQHPSVLGTPEEFYARLRKSALKLLGLAGALDEKAAFGSALVALENAEIATAKRTMDRVVGLESDQPYLYTDSWEAKICAQLMREGYHLALHPHMFKSIQTAKEAEDLFKQHPKLLFLPDTAHLTVAGEDIMAVLERNFDRIVAVHIKGWTSEYGRAFQFYSRGFCVELGEGDVNVYGVIRRLRDKRYTRWLVVEQDTAEDAVQAARRSRGWVKNRCGI